jgi:hypothetical protein
VWDQAADLPRTRAQEVPSGDPDLRIIAFDFDKHRGYEQARREQTYVIMTREKGLSVRDAAALYKELTNVESGFQ